MNPSFAMGLLFLLLLFVDPQYLEGKQRCFENREISIHIYFHCPGYLKKVSMST